MSDDQVMESTLRVRSIGVAPAKQLALAFQAFCESHPLLYFVDASQRRPREAVSPDSDLGRELARRAEPHGAAATPDDVDGIRLMLTEWLGAEDARATLEDLARELGYVPAVVARALTRVADTTPGAEAA